MWFTGAMEVSEVLFTFYHDPYTCLFLSEGK